MVLAAVTKVRGDVAAVRRRCVGFGSGCSDEGDVGAVRRTCVGFGSGCSDEGERRCWGCKEEVCGVWFWLQ